MLRIALRPDARGAHGRRARDHRAASTCGCAAARSRFGRSCPPRRGCTGRRASRTTRPAAMPFRAAAAVFVADLRGSFSGVMGLPLFETAELLLAAGVPRWAARPGAANGVPASMTTEILINANSHEARAAVVENGVLQEVFIERASRRGLISNIYKGRVSRVLPGMQAAFIEIGLERTAFLHASDIFDPRHEDIGHRGAAHREHPRPGGRGQRDPGAGGQGSAWAPRARGSRPTSRCPRAISSTCRRAAASACRRASRTRRSASGCAPRCRRASLADENAGYIVRTAAEEASAEALRADMHVPAQALASSCAQKGLRTQPGNLVHADLPLHLRILRDLLRPDVDRVLIDQAERAPRDAGVRRDLHARRAAAHRALSASRGRCSSCTTSRRRSRRRSTARCR